jgi:hypothetical protein
VQGADLPAVERLPEPVKPLVRRQALELRDASFRVDLKLLVDRLEPVFDATPRREEPAPPSWEATLQHRTHGLRRLRVTLSHSSHSVEYEMRALRANVLRVDGDVVGTHGLSDLWAASDDDHSRERYEFSMLDGPHARSGVVEVQLGNVTVDEVTLTVDGRQLYRGA